MKILMTSDTYLPRIGGGEYHVHYIVRELRRMGHEVTFVTTEKGSWEGDKEHPVIRVRYAGIFSLPSVFAALWKLSRGMDIVHAHYSYRLGFLSAIVAFLRGIPFTVTQHGQGLLPQAGVGFFYHQVFRLWRYWTMRLSGLIISTSEDMSVVIRECGFGSRIVPITNGYDADFFTPLPAPDFERPHLLTVRRLNPKNGVQYLIAALPFIREAHPALCVTCIGDGPWREKIVQLAKDLKVDDCVEFLGPLDHGRLREFYKQATVVVMPSTAESTSLTCIEAMAQERIVVASRVGGLIELIGADEERGYLASITDSQHSDYAAPFTLPEEKIRRLADRISHALTHREEAAGKAKAAADYAAKNFAWGTIARRTIEEVYYPLTHS